MKFDVELPSFGAQPGSLVVSGVEAKSIDEAMDKVKDWFNDRPGAFVPGHAKDLNGAWRGRRHRKEKP